MPTYLVVLFTFNIAFTNWCPGIDCDSIGHDFKLDDDLRVIYYVRLADGFEKLFLTAYRVPPSLQTWKKLQALEAVLADIFNGNSRKNVDNSTLFTEMSTNIMRFYQNYL